MGMLKSKNNNSVNVRSAGKASGAYSTGTSSFPVTGFPASAYLGNNRRGGGGQQSQPSPLAGAMGNGSQIDTKHLLIALAILIAVGYGLWHLDNRK